jgi:hypothetical protein
MNGKGYDELCFTFWYAAFGASDSTQLHVIKADPSSSTGQAVNTPAVLTGQMVSTAAVLTGQTVCTTAV